MRPRDGVRGGRTKAILGTVVSVSEAAPSLTSAEREQNSDLYRDFTINLFLLFLLFSDLWISHGSWIGSDLCALVCGVIFFCLRVKRRSLAQAAMSAAALLR